MKTKFLSIIAVLCLPFLSWAQESEAYKQFANEAGFQAVLFRGTHPEVYPFAYNGHFYWKTKTFKEGRVLFNGKWYGPIMLNVNAHLQELMFRPAGNRAPLSAPSELIEEFWIGNVHYLNLVAKGYDGAQNGFYEVIYEGKDILLKRVNKSQMENAGNNNGLAIGYDDPDYKDTVLKFFQYSCSYHFLRNGELTQFKGKSVLKGFYKDRKKDVNAFIKSAGIKQADFETFSKAVMNYVEHN